jgi:hypothetical protein
MKTNAGGDVDVEIGMVHPVQPPESGDIVENPVLQIDREVKKQEGHQKFEPAWPWHMLQHAPAFMLRQPRKSDRAGWRHDSRREVIKQHDAEIVRPATPTGNGPLPPGTPSFPKHHQKEHTGKGAEPQERFHA